MCSCFQPGRKPGCVAMRTGTAGGLWDVIKCEEKAKFLCKMWAEGVTPPPVPTTTPVPSCPEGWDSNNRISFCFKVSCCFILNYDVSIWCTCMQ